MNASIFPIYIEVRGIPQPKGSTKAFQPKGTKFPVITNANKKCRPWENTIKLVAQQKAPKELIAEALRIEMYFYMQKPKNYPKTKTLSHIKKPDLDKLTRAVNDALTGVIYKDDSQIVSLLIHKEYSDSPGVKLWIDTLNEKD